MKKLYFIYLTILMLFITSCSCKPQNNDLEDAEPDYTEQAVTPNQLEKTYYIISDTHFLANSLVESQDQKANLLTDGRIQEYDYDLMNNFIQKVNNDLPDAVMITGDLTYNGSKVSHLEFINLLSTIDNRVKVLVTQGNHDTFITNSTDFSEDPYKNISSITNDEFRELYANFGYSNYLAIDQNTNSYIYAIDETHWVIMLDSTVNRFNEFTLSNNAGGMVFEATLNWLEDNLKIAQENNINVVAFSHHNALTHNPLFENDYTMKKNTDLIALYQKYNVKLNFSGHLHIQNIQRQNKFYDISSSSILDYSNQFGILKIYDNAYVYTTQNINTNREFIDYSFNHFATTYYNKSINNKMFGDRQEECIEFLSKVNCYYFAGDYIAIDSLKKANPELFEYINSKIYGYPKTIIDVDAVDQRYLIVDKSTQPN